MDDATRAELAGLRERAYGPDADIADDPIAQARLVELEELALREQTEIAAQARAQAATAGGTAVDAPSGLWIEEPGSATDAGSAPVDESAAASRSRRRTVALWVAAVIAVGIAVSLGSEVGREQAAAPTPTPTPTVSASDEFSFAHDPTARVLQEIPVGNAFGNGVGYAAEAPDMPAGGQMRWAASLGTYYGWELWIAGVSGTYGEEHCLLIRRDARSEGRCAAASGRSVNSLIVDIDWADIQPEARPAGMNADQRVGFWWHEDSAVTVLLGARLSQR